MYYSQSHCDVRFEWGAQGLAALCADVVIIVDILSFSTSVDIVVGNSATVFPQSYDSAVQPPEGAIAVPRKRSRTEFSLSPFSLLHIPARTHIVLPSPNGAALSLAASERSCVLAGCLRNRSAVAAYAAQQGSSVAVIAAGERWPDGSLRPALEDMIGAGAIISALPGVRSPEAQTAATVFAVEQRSLLSALRQCSSGRELLERGFPEDIDLAANTDCSTAVPVLRNGAYVDAIQV